MTSDRWGAVKKLFEKALLLPPEERASFLDDRCDDTTVRKEVSALLEASDEATDFFDDLESAVLAVLQEVEAEEHEQREVGSDPLDLEGEEVACYLVEEHVGGGGMGIVYRAHDTQLGRDVALKFLPPYLGTVEEAEQRFVREARAAAALDHSNIATVYEIGRAKDGRRFIAMAYYEGETLKVKLSREELLPVGEALDYAIQIAEGLGRAHEAGIVHRDVKPANVLVTEEGEVKLVDFGLAKLKGADDITRTGDTLGTITYMAPEQLQGKEVGARADLFSFGVLLYEMLTGRHPFSGEYRQAVAYQIIHEDVEPPSTYREELPAKIDKLVLRCLEKEPEDRYDTAAGLLHDLQGKERATSQPVAPPSTSAAEVVLSDRDWLRMRRVAGIGALAVVVLLIGWWLLGGEAGEGPAAEEAVDADRVAVFPFVVRGSEELADYGEGMVELLGRSIDGAGPLQAVDANALLAQLEEDSSGRIRPEEAQGIAAGFGAGRYVLGSILQVGDEIRLSATWYGTDGEEIGSDEATAEGEEELLEGIDALARSVISEIAEEEASHRQRLAAQTTSSAEALKAYLEGQAALRSYDFEDAIEAFGRAVAEDSNFALALYGLSMTAGWIADTRRARQVARQAVALSEELPERDRRLVRAGQAYMEGRAEEAERLYRLLVNSYPTDVNAWYMLGETLFHFGGTRGHPVTEAKRPLEKALELDPTANEPLLHLIQIAVVEQDRAGLDSLTSGLERRRLSPDFETAFRIIRAYLVDERVTSDLEEELREASPTALWYVAYLLLPSEHLREVEVPVRRLMASDRPEEVQAGMRMWIAELQAARGQLEAAREELKAVAPLDRATYLTSRGLLATLPFLPESEKEQEERQRLLRQLSAWDAEAVPERLLPVLYLPPAEVYPPAQFYLLGLLRAEKGERIRALEAAAQIREMEVPGFTLSGPSDYARAVEAEVERQEGNPEEALRRLETLKHQADPVLVLTTLYSAARERFLRAELLAETGRFEEALSWYETFDGVALGDLSYLGPAHLGRAQVLEELGRLEEAAEAYERFVELWRNADPAFEPMVEEARERLDRLEREELASAGH